MVRVKMTMALYLSLSLLSLLFPFLAIPSVDSFLLSFLLSLPEMISVWCREKGREREGDSPPTFSSFPPSFFSPPLPSSIFDSSFSFFCDSFLFRWSAGAERRRSKRRERESQLARKERRREEKDGGKKRWRLRRG